MNGRRFHKNGIVQPSNSPWNFHIIVVEVMTSKVDQFNHSLTRKLDSKAIIVTAKIKNVIIWSPRV